jgi:hypothetical protein
MTEPGAGALRPTAMKLTTILAVATAALLAGGCGQQAASPSKADQPVGKVGSCGTDSAGVVHALPVYEAVDLDHDGVGNALMVTREDSTCPNLLFSKVAGGYAWLDLKDVQLDLKSAKRVVVPGRNGDLVAIREVHPRGGFQEHLYGYGDGKLAEVTTPGGAPPVPFVATDTKGGNVSVSCTDGGLVVRQAVAHTPPGIVFAWDIREKTYRLDGTTATPGAGKEVRDNVLDQNLARDYPELVKREMFTTGCG